MKVEKKHTEQQAKVQVAAIKVEQATSVRAYPGPCMWKLAECRPKASAKKLMVCMLCQHACRGV